MINLGHGVRLHLQDPDAPLIEFVSNSGKHGAYNLLELADRKTASGKSTVFAEAVKEWLADRAKENEK